MFFLHYNAVKMKTPESMTAAWFGNSLSGGLTICKQLLTFRKRKSYQTCLKIHKRSFFVLTKCM